MPADAATTPGLPVFTGRPVHLQRAGLALLLSTLCHGLVVLTLSLQAGDTLDFGSRQVEPVAAPIIVARLMNLSDTPVADVPSPLIEAPPAIPLPEPAERTAAAPATAKSESRSTGGAPIGQDSARYYIASELDRRPTPVTPVNLPYPGADPQAEGYLLLQLFINEKGRVDKVDVMLNDGADLVAPIAVKVFGDVLFSPGIRNERPVKSQMLIELKLRPETAASR